MNIDMKSAGQTVVRYMPSSRRVPDGMFLPPRANNVVWDQQNKPAGKGEKEKRGKGHKTMTRQDNLAPSIFDLDYHLADYFKALQRCAAPLPGSQREKQSQQRKYLASR
jgi:hypothetical protein